MGDDDTTVVVEAPQVPEQISPPEPSSAELWYIEHERRHSEHMAHLESIRESMRAEVARLEDRISELDARVAVAESSQGESLGDALDAVATVGQTVADITTAINPEPEVVNEVPPAPSSSSNDGGTGPTTEVIPDTEGATPTAPTNGRQQRRGSRWW